MLREFFQALGVIGEPEFPVFKATDYDLSRYTQRSLLEEDSTPRRAADPKQRLHQAPPTGTIETSFPFVLTESTSAATEPVKGQTQATPGKLHPRARARLNDSGWRQAFQGIQRPRR